MTGAEHLGSKLFSHWPESSSQLSPTPPTTSLSHEGREVTELPLFVGSKGETALDSSVCASLRLEVNSICGHMHSGHQRISAS